MMFYLLINYLNYLFDFFETTNWLWLLVLFSPEHIINDFAVIDDLLKSQTMTFAPIGEYSPILNFYDINSSTPGVHVIKIKYDNPVLNVDGIIENFIRNITTYVCYLYPYSYDPLTDEEEFFVYLLRYIGVPIPHREAANTFSFNHPVVEFTIKDTRFCELLSVLYEKQKKLVCLDILLLEFTGRHLLEKDLVFRTLDDESKKWVLSVLMIEGSVINPNTPVLDLVKPLQLYRDNIYYDISELKKCFEFIINFPTYPVRVIVNDTTCADFNLWDTSNLLGKFKSR